MPKSLQTGHSISIDAEINGTVQTYMAEKILVSVGRGANLSNIGLDNTEIIINQGYVSTNELIQTKESHI